MNDFLVTKNFKLKEYQCKCGCGTAKIKHELALKIQQLRDMVGKPLTINSSYRCPTHNKKVGGATNSYHLKGMACDIKLPKGETIQTMREYAKIVGFNGVGLYNTFIHVDVRDIKSEWDERKWNTTT